MSHNFQVFSLDLRGHGKSTWTPGHYSWERVGTDLSHFPHRVIQRPAIVSGNSSGGLLALWLTAHNPDCVAGIILEDAPIFSAEMPRFRDRDTFVYQGLKHTVEALGDVQHRDLADYFRGQEPPTKRGRVRRVPEWFVNFLSRAIQRREASHPGQPVDIPYVPGSLRLLLKSLSTFDPDFARAFVDGRFYQGFDHAQALQQVLCPMLMLHADWFRHAQYGLVGAMDADDAARVQALVPHAQYRKISANHVTHFFKPNAFVHEVTMFARGIGKHERSTTLLDTCHTS